MNQGIVLAKYSVVSSVADGARPKIWVEDADGSLFLYKKSRMFPTGECTYESYSEFLAKALCDQLEIPCVDIVMDRDAILSKKVWDGELKSFLEFENSEMIKERFCDEFVQILLFDALIGNSDRHLGNVLFNEERGFYPLFDNGSSLCCYVEEEKIECFLKDRLRFSALVWTKSRPVLRFGRKITHCKLVNDLREMMPKQFQDFCERMDGLDTSILETVGLSEQRVELLKRFVSERAEWFRQ